MGNGRARHSLERLRSRPWAITPEGLDTIVLIAERNMPISPEMIAAHLGRPLENTYDVTVRDGVATLPVSGPLFRYANLFTQLSGATSYELIARDFTQAIENPQVKAVMLLIDSPGGECDGCSALAELIFRARGTKPIIGVIADLGASAAYWLAAACDQIVASDTALVGSLGCRMQYVDFSAMDAAAGVQVVDMVSDQSPKKKDDTPATEQGRAAIQTMLNDMAAVFLERVAAYRGVSLETVLADYGQGGVFVGAKALTAGLVDAIACSEDVQAQLAAGGSRYIGGEAPAARQAGPAAELHLLTAIATALAPTQQAAFSEKLEAFSKGQLGLEQVLAFITAASPVAAAVAAAAFPTGERVQSAVTRDIPVQEGQVGTVVAIEEGVTAYAVDFGLGDERTGYRWLLESELVQAPAAEGEDPEADDADPVPDDPAVPLPDAAAQAVLIASAERVRVLGILQLAQPGLETLIDSCVQDPACTPAAAAFCILEAQREKAQVRAKQFANDEAQLAAPAPTAPTEVLTGDRAVAARVLATYRRATHR